MKSHEKESSRCLHFCEFLCLFAANSSAYYLAERRIANCPPTQPDGGVNAAERTKWKKRREIVWPVLLAGTITLCSGYPAAVPDSWLQPDKLGHLAAYAVLATALVRHPALTRWRTIGAVGAILLASAYGLGDEFRQGLTAGVRRFDLADWAADTVGAVVAVVLYVRWTAYRRLLEKPVFKRARTTKQTKAV
jgi:VanZ family protein